MVLTDTTKPANRISAYSCISNLHIVGLSSRVQLNKMLFFALTVQEIKDWRTNVTSSQINALKVTKACKSLHDLCLCT